ncbi:hypothetical protein RM190_04960 [Paracoccus sp. CPCC 101403]|uniref:Uncharacterized protein n=1 Tax=Paracoccus broussonetiae TaxID=3075834 RepID=A0ABU3EAF0_9RHOB|nr:hypothetical protein [Paracoccus sp. CPCC 101403]MDT1061199.1 hypothetical protein [Paracoccus sp. CPCC 101403]
MKILQTGLPKMADDLLKAALLERAKREMAARQAKQPEIGEDGLPEPNTGLGRAMRAVRNPINAVNRAFSNIYTLGSLDEIEGAADAAMTDQSFSEARAASRARSDQQTQQYPIMTTAAGLAGAVTSPVAQAVAGAAPAAATLPGKIAVGGATGAGLGAAQGFLEGEGGLSNRLASAGWGTLAGAGVGAAVPALASGAGAAYRGVRNALADRRFIGSVSSDLGISRRGSRLLTDTLGMDDAARMRSALQNTDAMLADAGPSAQGALDTVIQSPGEGARTALRRIDDRAEAAGGRLRGTLDNAMTGSNVGAQGGRQFSDTARLQGDVRKATAGARKSVYDAAYDQPIDYASEAGMRLEGLLKRVPAKAINDANLLMKLDDNPSQQIIARIADDGSVTLDRMPDVRQWDYIKRALDQSASTGEGQGALGGQTPLGNAYKGLSRTIRQALGEASPAYDDATRVAASAIDEVQAIKTGADALRPQVTRAEFEASLDGMSGGELAAVKRGLRQQIDDTLANVRAVASDPNIDARQAAKALGDLSSEAAQDKMKMLLGEDWGPVKSALDDAAQALGLRARVATNSRTFGRQQFGQMIDDSIQPGRIASGEILGPLATPRGILQNITGSTPQAVQRAGASIRNELADVLTRPNALATLNALEAARSANPILPAAGQGISNVLNVLGLRSLPATVPEVRNRLQ